nr:MAG TPA: hypothetical protein [Caudoviricetes sp.]
MLDREITLSNGKDYFDLEMYLGVGSMIAIEKELKANYGADINFFSGLKLIEKGELTAALIYICGTLHEYGKISPIGLTYFDKHGINFLEYSNELTRKLISVIESSTKPSVNRKK